MKNRRQRILWLQVLVCAISCLCAASLEAQLPLGPAFLVNPPSVGTQDQQDLRFDENGNLWIAWVDFQDIDGQSSGFDRVIARAMSLQGDLGPVLVLADTSDIPFTPVESPLIVPKRDGSLEVFYVRSNVNGFTLVYGQRFSAAGEPLTGRFLISPGPPWASGRTAAAALPDGGVFLANLGALCEVCSKMKVSLYGRVLAPDDSLASPFFRIPSRLSGAPDTGVQSLAVDGLGNATAVWSFGHGYPDDRDYSNIRARRFSSAGVPISPEFVVNTTLRGTQFAPSVAADAAGDFVVVWQTQFPASSIRSIFGQRFSKMGKKVGPELRVNEDRLEYDGAPSVAMDLEGNFVVVWESFSLTHLDCIKVRARLFRRDGKPAGPEFPAAPGDAACGEAPKVAFGPNGVFAIAWEVELGFSPDTGADFDVHAARFSVSPALP
jgi:hypothetical protein